MGKIKYICFLVYRTDGENVEVEIKGRHRVKFLVRIEIYVAGVICVLKYMYMKHVKLFIHILVYCSRGKEKELS